MGNGTHSFTKEELLKVPLTETGLDDHLIKVLVRSGVETVEDILSHESLGERLSPQLSKDFYHLVDSYYENQDEFARLIMSVKDKPKNEGRPNQNEKPVILGNGALEPDDKQAWGSGKTKVVTFGVCYPLPSTDYAFVLKDFERGCSQAFDALCQDNPPGLVFEIFDDPVRFDKLSDAFGRLFMGYKDKQATIAPMIEGNIPNSYIAFVAWRTRDKFSDNNLWGNFFDEYDLEQYTCNDLKKLFMLLLEKRSLITYSPKEKADYMFSTALLHGGLGREHWEDLWAKCLIPLANNVVKEPSLGPLYSNGYGVLAAVLNQETGCSPRVATLSVLHKMPADSAAVIMQGAFDLALQIVRGQCDQNQSFSQQAIGLADDLLPNVAIETLGHVVSARENTKAKSAAVKSRIHVLPKPSLGFDEDLMCPVALVNRTEMSPELQGRTVQFSINGNLVGEDVISTRGGRCILSGFKTPLEPASEYHFELKVLEEAGNQNSGCVDATSVISRPRINGLWEFSSRLSGQWIQRAAGGAGRSRKTLYAVAPGKKLVFDGSTETIAIADCGGPWKGWEAQIIKTSPGVRGRLLNEHNEIVDSWHESISVEVIHPGRIGQTISGKDLFVDYRVSASSRRNGALPVIVLTASRDAGALGRLRFKLLVNGQETLLVPNSALSMRCGGEDIQQLEIDLRRIDGFPSLAEECDLTVWLDDEKSPVCRYRFGIVPIKGFHLAQINRHDEGLTACYRFVVTEDAFIVNNDEESFVQEDNG